MALFAYRKSHADFAVNGLFIKSLRDSLTKIKVEHKIKNIHEAQKNEIQEKLKYVRGEQQHNQRSSFLLRALKMIPQKEGEKKSIGILQPL